MVIIKNVMNHVKLVMRHKAEVFKCMKACGRPIQGLLHDISKFSPTELFESVKYYQGDRSPIEACKEDKGYSDAWFHHRGRNKHHSQYWVDISFGEIIPCEIPEKYLIEHICDNVAAGKVYLGGKWNRKSPLEYYKNKDCKSFYAPQTRDIIENCYTFISIFGWEAAARQIKLQGINMFKSI